MTHIEIYNKLELLEEKIAEYVDENCVGLKTEIFALQFTMARATWVEIHQVMAKLETNESFCISCFYLGLKSHSQGLSRYLKLEKLEKDADAKFILDYIYLENRYDELKDLVIKLSHLAVNQDECEKIKNTAYAQLKGKKPKRELRYEDDEDDDFRLN